MVSVKRQVGAVTHPAHPAPTATAAAGEVAVEEYGYGLGPPTGILVLRYPPSHVVVDFPEWRDDLVHQMFWSPDGVLAVRRGTTTGFLGPHQALWLRRGVVAEVRALDVQTVLRVCLREAPRTLTQVSAGTLDLSAATQTALLGIARPRVSEETALAVRANVLADLDGRVPAEVAHGPARSGPAQEVVRALLRDPADPTMLNDWAARLHVSPKTLQRDFERVYGMSFTAWRTHTRLHASTALLHRLSVTEAAHRVGYASASAFVAAFTREFGETPGRFVDARMAG